MTSSDYAALVAGIAAVLSALSAMFTAVRQGRLNRRLARLQAVNIERPGIRITPADQACDIGVGDHSASNLKVLVSWA